MDQPPTPLGARIADWLPACDTREYHETLCHASSQRTYAALRSVDFAEASTVRLLLRARGMGGSPWTADRLTRFGFVVLEEHPADEIVLGLVGRFWRPAGGIVRVQPADFRSFDEPGYAKAAWNFKVDAAGTASCKLSTETRVRCTDDTARRRFKMYWRVVGPFSAYIRRKMLESIRREAEF